MSEEVIETELIETPEVIDTPEIKIPEASETPEKIEEEIKPEYKPWKAKQPDHIPYDRFAEVARERRELETRLREIEAKNREYEELKAKTAKITSIDELTEKMSELSMSEYNRELVRLAKAEFEQEYTQKEQTRRAQEEEQRIISTFEKKINDSAKVNPEIIQAVEHVTQFSDRMDIQLRAALVTDDNSPEVIYHIATTEGLLERLLSLNPVRAISEVGKISAKFDKDHSIPATVIPKTMPTKPTGSPKTTSVGTPSGSIRKLSDAEIAKLSSSEYAKARKDGRI